MDVSARQRVCLYWLYPLYQHRVISCIAVSAYMYIRQCTTEWVHNGTPHAGRWAGGWRMMSGEGVRTMDIYEEARLREIGAREDWSEYEAVEQRALELYIVSTVDGEEVGCE